MIFDLYATNKLGIDDVVPGFFFWLYSINLYWSENNNQKRVFNRYVHAYISQKIQILVKYSFLQSKQIVLNTTHQRKPKRNIRFVRKLIKKNNRIHSGIECIFSLALSVINFYWIHSCCMQHIPCKKYGKRVLFSVCALYWFSTNECANCM